MGVEVVPAPAAGWAAVASLFDGPGDPGSCFCQWFRLRSRDFEAASAADRRAAFESEVGPAPGTGVVAMRDGEALGWCAVAPLDGYVRLAAGRSPFRRHLTAEPGTWAVTCFVVPPAHRGRGLTHALLDGAIGFARQEGAIVLEAIPVDTAARARTSAADLYHGPLALFLAHGFTEVARPSAARAVVRLSL